MQKQEFDFSVNLLQSIIWRYNQADNLIGILTAKQTWYDNEQTSFWQDWITNVFDLRTANDFGCAVWSIILKLPISITQEPDYLTKPVFGFGADGGGFTYRKNFNRGNFAVRSQSTINLTLAQKRLVLQLRYAQLICRGNVVQINQLMKYIFRDYGLVYVLDSLNMEFADYVFTFALPSELVQVLTFYDLLPRPAAIGVRYVVIPDLRWGFGPYRKNFNHGNFGGSGT